VTARILIHPKCIAAGPPRAALEASIGAKLDPERLFVFSRDGRWAELVTRGPWGELVRLDGSRFKWEGVGG
jgi:hypothetical protein